MDYNKIAKTLSSVTNGNKQILTVFEHTFRENVSSLDLQILASGSIPSNIISNCIASALQKAAAEADTLSLPIVSAQIWNPLTAVLLQDSITKPQSEKSKTANPKPLLKEKTSSKKTSDNVSTDISTDDVSRIRKALQCTQPASGIYNNIYHSHISCVKPDCKFCYDLYRQINITKCIGHKPCHNSGYYPHVGKTLWKMIKGRHNRGDKCDIKETKCKPGQILALANIEICDDRGDATPLLTDWSEMEEPNSPVYYSDPNRAKRSRTSAFASYSDEDLCDE